jgi:hypothetical protein
VILAMHQRSTHRNAFEERTSHMPESLAGAATS